MFNFSNDNSLHKYAEKNLGENVLAVFSHYDDFEFEQLSNCFGKKFKLNLFGLDLRAPDDKSKVALANTLNKYHYSSYILIDYPVFKHITEVYHRVGFDKYYIKKFIILDPVDGKTGSCTSLLGKKIQKPEIELKKLSLDFINAQKVEIISILDKSFALKFSAQINHSKLIIAKNYAELLSVIQKEFHE